MKGPTSKIKCVKNEIENFQKGDYGHPYTCENDSKGHPPLVPVVRNLGAESEITLACTVCDWTQDIPHLMKEIYRAM